MKIEHRGIDKKVKGKNIETSEQELFREINFKLQSSFWYIYLVQMDTQLI